MFSIYYRITIPAIDPATCPLNEPSHWKVGLDSSHNLVSLSLSGTAHLPVTQMLSLVWAASSCWFLIGQCCLPVGILAIYVAVSALSFLLELLLISVPGVLPARHTRIPTSWTFWAFLISATRSTLLGGCVTRCCCPSSLEKCFFEVHMRVLILYGGFLK